MLNDELNLYDINIDPNKKFFKYKKQLKGLLLVIISIAGICFIYHEGTSFIKNKQNENISISENKTNVVSIDNSESFPDEIVDEKYKYYIDKEFNFKCPYPADFQYGENIGGGNRALFISRDGKTKMFIGAVKNNLDLSAYDIMQQYIIDAGGKVDYKANGDTWYVVSNDVGGVSYYRKCFVDKDLIYWFELDTENDTSENVSEYIEYIESKFKRI